MHIDAPSGTVDAVIELEGDRVVLIRRGFPPFGWAFPGGFIDRGKESAEQACVREALEETGLHIRLVALLGVYSRPDRDPRRHTMSAAWVATATGEPEAGDDAAEVHAVPAGSLLDREFAFDHMDIAVDYLHWRRTGTLPPPRQP